MKLLGLCAALITTVGLVSAGEKKLMHCFAFTELAEATPADWAAFKKATDELPKKIPGVSRVWHGKLRSPLTITTVNDQDAGKKLNAGEKDVPAAKTNRARRTYGVCMEMADANAFDVYGKHPVHDAWVKVYAKVRADDSTTYQILGQ